MNRRIPFLLFLILVLVKSASAQAQVTVPPQAIAISLLALTFSFDVVAIGYIISKLIPQTGINEWLNTEYWEIAKSAMLIIGIYAILSFMTNISSFFVPTSVTSGCPAGASGSILVDAACNFLQTIAPINLDLVNTGAGLSGVFKYLMSLSGALGALDALRVSLYVPVPIPIGPGIGFKFGFTAAPYQNSGLEGITGGQFQSILNDVIQYIAFPVALLTLVQLYFLPFVFLIGIDILIPIGLILRAMPFTRGIGGAMIAIGIAVSVIYPSLLVVFNSTVSSALGKITVLNPTEAVCDIPLLCPFISLIVGPFEGWATAVVSINSIFPALNSILSYTSWVVLQFLLYILDLGIGYSLANGIAVMLGGQIRISITDKIKLA